MHLHPRIFAYAWSTLVVVVVVVVRLLLAEPRTRRRQRQRPSSRCPSRDPLVLLLAGRVSIAAAASQKRESHHHRPIIEVVATGSRDAKRRGGLSVLHLHIAASIFPRGTTATTSTVALAADDWCRADIDHDGDATSSLPASLDPPVTTTSPCPLVRQPARTHARTLSRIPLTSSSLCLLLERPSRSEEPMQRGRMLALHPSLRWWRNGFGHDF